MKPTLKTLAVLLAVAVALAMAAGPANAQTVWSHKFPGQKDWVELPAIGPDSSDVRHHPFQGEIDHFVECLRQDRESHGNLDDVIKTHEVVFAALRSYETGRLVQLPLVMDDDYRTRPSGRVSRDGGRA